MKQKINKGLEKLLIKFCESKISNTPLADGINCTKPNKICKYYKRKNNQNFCYKETYTIKKSQIYAIS